MGKPLRVLIVEDSEIDAGLVLHQLEHGGYDPEFERVETAEGMRTSLREKTWDVILCDYTMPRFDGQAAIALFKETGLDIPMIIVSGAIGEETAVAAMKAGAHDYIMKDKLARLVPAIERELRDSHSRKAHREMELQYRAIVEAQDDAICRWRPDMTLTYANTGYMDLFDIEEKDIGCRKWIDFTPEAERAAVVSFYREFLQNKRKATYEHDVRLKDGSLRTYLWTDIPLFDDQGICWEIQSVGRDITEQKRAEEELQKLASVVQNSSELVNISSLDGRMIFLNETGSKILGISQADIRQHSIMDVIPENLKALVQTEILPTVMDKGEWKGDLQYRNLQTNARTDVHTMTFTIRDVKTGSPLLLANVSLDITDRKRMEAELRQAEEKYRGIFEGAQEGIFRTTPEGRLVMANPAMARIFGYESPHEMMTVINDAARQLYVKPENRAEIMKIVEENDSMTGWESQFYRQDGAVIWCRMSVRAIRNDKGKTLYYEGIIEDITEQRQNTERLRRALRGTVQAVAGMVEAKDPYTAGHQRRVSDLARAIATQMNLFHDQIDGLRIAGTIHDIGKISVPAEILSVPRKLTPIEFSLIKTHPQSGYDILQDIEFPWPIARMILEHHERMDGSGYPNGLTGDKLLIESRILIVADVVEAIASHRPYRASLGLGAALEEITCNRETLYDPEAVDACLRLFNEKGYQLVD